MTTHTDILRRGASIACFAACWVLAGCGAPPAAAPDYRIQHPISAQEKVFNLSVPVMASAKGVSAPQLNNMKRFAADYLRRGRGPLLVSYHGDPRSFTKSRSQILSALGVAGVQKHRVFFQNRSTQSSKAGSAELSYAGYVVRVPKCGDWSGHAGFDPANGQHTDFGCSFQRNTGLIISNPADLKVAGEPPRSDAQASDRVIQTYRDGKAMGTPAPVLEQKEFSDIK